LEGSGLVAMAVTSAVVMITNNSTSDMLWVNGLILGQVFHCE